MLMILKRELCLKSNKVIYVKSSIMLLVLLIPMIFVASAFQIQPLQLAWTSSSSTRQFEENINLYASSVLVDDTTKRKERRQVINQVSQKQKLSRNELLDQKWWMMYGKLVEYKKEYGNCLVPQNYDGNISKSLNDEDDANTLQGLGKWVSMQRRKYKIIVQQIERDPSVMENMLRRKSRSITHVSKRIEALQNIGFVWDANEATWLTMFEKFRAYRKETLLNQVDADDISVNPEIPFILDFPQCDTLGMWISNQRTQYRYLNEGKPSSLTQERIARLESESFIWCQKDAVWWQRYHELKLFQKNNGHCIVPARYELHPSLGNWVSAQRAYFKKNMLSNDRKMHLDRIGFTWDPSEQFWNERFEELKLYKAEHGHCFVPKSCNQYEHLGHWISNQRRLGKLFHRGEECGGMTEKRIELLNDVGFGWPDEDDEYDCSDEC